MSKLEELCTIKQACFSEQAGRTTIYKRINEGHYIAVKIGGSTRILVSSLKAYRRAFGVTASQANANPKLAEETSVSTDAVKSGA